MPADRSDLPEMVLPLTPDEITSQWLSDCLGHKVKSFEITEKILLATASKLFVQVTYEREDENVEQSMGSKPKHLCIKGGFNPAIVAQFADIVIKMYQREVDFFNRVAPTLEHVDLLKCYWGGHNSKQGIVFLDDLGRMGNTFGDPTKAWPVERVRLGVEQLAGLHARTWGARNEDYPWLAGPDHYERTIMKMCTWWQGLVVGESRAHFPGGWSEARITAAMEKHFASRDEKFLVLTHGDSHQGNTFVTPGGEPRFLDWQLIHVGSALHDVAYFVVGALSPADRRAHEMDLLGHYLGALALFGGPALTVDVVLIEYRKSMLSGIGWMLTPYDLQPKERVEAMSERYASAILDHQAIELVESL